MDKLERLLHKAKLKTTPKLSVTQKALLNNPYVGMSFEDLLDYLSGDNYRAPPLRTWEWTQYLCALMSAPHTGGGLIE